MTACGYQAEQDKQDGKDGKDAVTLRRVEGVIEQDLDDQFLLFRTGTSDVLHLNTVASDVWALLAEPATAAELAHSIAAAYGVDEERVSDDLAPMLSTLLEHGMVVECPQG